MKVATLYSGGKDSNYSLFLASKYHKVSCLIYMKSKNEESYMFQSVGSEIIEEQSKSLNIPLLIEKTSGEKEKELDDLKNAIKRAKEEYKVEGIVTGAINSAYQSSRIQKICYELGLYCFNPLWQINEKEYLEDLKQNKFEVLTAAIASYPLTKENLGDSIFSLPKSDQFSSIGEGGEFESLVLDSPLFKNKLKIEFDKLTDSENSGTIKIKSIKSTPK